MWKKMKLMLSAAYPMGGTRMVWVEESPNIIDLTRNMAVAIIDLTEDSDISVESVAACSTISVESSIISMGSSVPSSQWSILPGDSFLMELSDIDHGDIPRWNLGGGADASFSQ